MTTVTDVRPATLEARKINEGVSAVRNPTHVVGVVRDDGTRREWRVRALSDDEARGLALAYDARAADREQLEREMLAVTFTDGGIEMRTVQTEMQLDRYSATCPKCGRELIAQAETPCGNDEWRETNQENARQSVALALRTACPHGVA